MDSRPTAALAGVLVAVSFTVAQDQPSKETASPSVAEARFNDGSLVRMTILQENLDVMTKYGKLTIPIRDIRRIDVGLHIPHGLDQQMEQAIRLLSSSAYKEREEATRFLFEKSCQAYPFLKKASQQENLEATNRIASLLKRIADKHPSGLLQRREEDVVHTVEFPIIGRITAPILKARSVHFGELALKLSDVRTVHLGAGGEYELTVDAAKHGSAPDQWLDTTVIVDSRLRLVVTAEGQVDLWPAGAGQYLTTPKGYTTAGKGSSFMAGALVGRIGEQGKVFLVGERYDGSLREEGRFFVQIVPSPWNNASVGSYKVRIHTDHLALANR